MARPDDVTRGVTLIIVASLLLSGGDALVKYASASFSLWQLYVARSLIALPILVVLLLRGGPPATLVPTSPTWVLARSMLLVLMWVAYYAALPVMSLSVAAVAFYTSPLFTALFAALLLGEPVTRRGWAAIAVGFAGVLVILRPDAGGLSAAILLPILAAVFYALSGIVTRGRCVAERALVLSLGLNLCLVAVGALAIGALMLWQLDLATVSAYPFLLDPWLPMGSRAWIIIAVLAVLMVAASTAVARAYQLAPSALIGTFGYAYLIFAVLWGFLLFGEVPDGATITGMVLITAAGLLVVRQPMITARAIP